MPPGSLLRGMARFREGEETGTTRDLVRMDASWLAEGLPRAPSQPSGVRRHTPHEVLFTAWRNDQDSDCLMDACLRRGSQHGYSTIEVQVDVKAGAL
jgi:hypothetical protein